ncbi:hypothetical protein A3I35_01910 [Candidatus Falkowbacteria bacterium RIFCSPLOWO2_02_FULL_45_15]|uniref:Gfo/Idh/MocA-like oxidoreductase N-terminal domain-containing protein n=2 Tax=Candidatus Falkowiibacteriota TaxID=1752728 RepID=A0A1F5RKB7_9BACT|nr:MAG: hypothetical protein A3D54_01575 [Candidatus Falkowbacteria bacterium RIFCSPHIGHO2_02_FULL_45_15]OGF19581.1 MAG: hypothetical protein A3I35_01910 [Candidatus Falkowbacteria bacterium RIFCSPLOWO2_02_FULL_45_15]
MKKIRTVIIGLGKIAHGYEDNAGVVKRIKYPTHLSAIKKDKRFILVGGSDLSVKAQKVFASKLNKPVALYADYREMIKMQKPDLAVVATPTGTHVRACKDIIKLGVKNILCEKPIDYSLMDAQSLIKLAKKKRIKLAFNYFRVYDKRYKKLINLIKNEEFGKIQAIKIQYSKGIYNSATHVINLLEKIFGPVKKAEATAKISGGQDPNVNFTLEFKDVTPSFRSFAGKSLILSIEMKFDKKRLRIIKDKSKDFNIQIGTSLLDVYNNLYNFITANKKIACGGQEALQTLRVADAVIKSFKFKKAISL